MTEGITWAGIDAHKETINIKAFLPDGRSFEKKVINTPKKISKLARDLVRIAPGEVRCCYEAGPLGFVLKRQLESAAPLICEVIAPSLIPKKPGEKIKTDRRDANKLAHCLRAGMLTEVHPPSEEEEAARRLSRCRETAKNNVADCRQRLGKFLLHMGVRYTVGKQAWTKRHRLWLKGLSFRNKWDQRVFDEHLVELEHQEERLKRLNELLEELSEQEPYREPVAYLRCFRGIDTVSAMVIVTELYGVMRFESPRKLMSYIGLVPSEHSTGEHQHRGCITKAGNKYVRRILIEASWHYRHRPLIGAPLRRRRTGQPDWVISIADKAMSRLYRRYRRLMERGKPHNKIATAIARELVGFIWDVMVRGKLRNDANKN